MRQLFLKEWKVTKLFNLLLIGFILTSYVLNFPSLEIYVWIIFGLLPVLFYQDYHNNVNRFIVGLPISRKRLVFVRYLYLITLSASAILFLWLVDFVAQANLPFFVNEAMTLMAIIKLFWVTSFQLSIFIPIFYFFKKFTNALTVLMISFTCIVYFIAVMKGNQLITFDDTIEIFFDKLISIQPYLIPVLLSMVSLLISYQLSAWIFSRRDII